MTGPDASATSSDVEATDSPRRRPPARERGGTPARGRKLRPAGRRNVARLLDASLTVFADRGFHATRVDDICDEAGVSHGTFYLYFSSKEDLFRTLVDDVVDQMWELAGRLPPVPSGIVGRRALRGWLDDFIDLYERHWPTIDTWNQANATDGELARLGARVLRRFVDRLVARIEENGQVPIADPRTSAVTMVAMVERSITFGLGGLTRVDRDELAETLTGILHVGVFGGRRITA